ncbi:MAG: serine O-acetyltransferase [Alphaproteobacteria bacterium]|nr:serine O-acetyltransferase [Alphaproteobacteria bacterium]
MLIVREIRNIIAHDPAARHALEVIFFYPSFHAMLCYRFCHVLWNFRLRFLARWLMQFCRFFTGIEIHPAAKIGENFFIDHAMAVVIGETAEIGNNVTLYHSVTLGGVSPADASGKQRGKKRHPSLCDNVIVGCGAHILGPITIGENARIGANAVVLQDVPRGVTVVGIPARPIVPPSKPVTACAAEAMVNAQPSSFVPFAVYDCADDPVLHMISSLQERVLQLEKQLEHQDSASDHPSAGHDST